MAEIQAIAYNVAALVCALFVLEFGADKFVDSTAAVSKRTGIPPGIIALLTAGAEWEELAVVVVSLARNRSSLAIGNVVGSTISNILGAFSLGLLFRKDRDVGNFDRSSKIYAALLLVITSLAAGLIEFVRNVSWRVLGGFAIAAFILYVLSVAWIIYRGIMSAPELSDSDSSVSDGYVVLPQEEDGSDEPNISGNEQDRYAAMSVEEPHYAYTTDRFDEPIEQANPQSAGISTGETVSDVQYRRMSRSLASAEQNSERDGRVASRSLTYHVIDLLIGILAVILSAYVLSHAATNLVVQLGISDVLFGVVILSIATTLPEKLIAVVSGFRGEMDIMVANTVGSNIFLLTLCLGIIWVSNDGIYDENSVTSAETGVMFGSAVALTLAVCLGEKWPRLIGTGMFIGYVAFIIVEFTSIY